MGRITDNGSMVCEYIIHKLTPGEAYVYIVEVVPKEQSEGEIIELGTIETLDMKTSVIVNNKDIQLTNKLESILLISNLKSTIVTLKESQSHLLFLKSMLNQLWRTY